VRYNDNVKLDSRLIIEKDNKQYMCIMCQGRIFNKQLVIDIFENKKTRCF